MFDIRELDLLWSLTVLIFVCALGVGRSIHASMIARAGLAIAGGSPTRKDIWTGVFASAGEVPCRLGG